MVLLKLGSPDILVLIVIINFTVWSFVEFVPYILKFPGVKFFLSERPYQDPLEMFFGCQRQRECTNENPTCSDFLKNTQACVSSTQLQDMFLKVTAEAERM